MMYLIILYLHDVSNNIIVQSFFKSFVIFKKNFNNVNFQSIVRTCGMKMKKIILYIHRLLAEWIGSVSICILLISFGKSYACRHTCICIRYKPYTMRM